MNRIYKNTIYLSIDDMDMFYVVFKHIICWELTPRASRNVYTIKRGGMSLSIVTNENKKGLSVPQLGPF